MRVLVLFALLMLPVEAPAFDDSMNKTCRQMQCVGTGVTKETLEKAVGDCISAASCIMSQLNALDPAARPPKHDGGLSDEDFLEPLELAARYDALVENAALLQAYFKGAAGDKDGAIKSQFELFSIAVLPVATDAGLKTIREKIAPVAHEDGKPEKVAAPQPPVSVARTPLEREAAVERAEKAEAQLAAQPEPDPVKTVAAAKDFLRGAAPAGAERLLDRLIESGQDDPEALRLRGTARYQQNDWTGAAEDAEAALKRDPRDAYAKELAGAARMMERRLALKAPSLKAGEEKKAQEDGGVSGAERWTSYPAGAGGKPDLARWLSDVARKIRIGDRKGALRDLTRILGRDPRNVRALGLRAHLMNRFKDPEAALAEADKALALSPKDPDALRERAYALVQLGRAAEALALLDEAIRLEPGNALGYLYRGKAYEALGRRSEAQADYARAFSIDPALRHFFDEEARPAATAAPERRLPVALPRFVAGLSFLLGLPLVLWALWRGYRASAGATTRPSGEPDPAPGPVETLTPGMLLSGNFRIERVLGRGGMGMVYEATDLALQRPVAVKQLRTPEESPELAERFVREARVVARLAHERIVQIFVLVEEAGRLYMVFERIDGRSLDEELAERRRLEPREVLAVLGDVCAALEAAHAAGVIHRDLKPANVMRAKDGRCKVMDFGIAHQSSGDGLTRTEPWGTPPYMAPEQEQGRVCPETDLYALACMAFELLTGVRPFAGTADKLALRFPRPSSFGLPSSLDSFMERALDPGPERRFRSAGEFLKAFEGCLQTPRIGA